MCLKRKTTKTSLYPVNLKMVNGRRALVYDLLRGVPHHREECFLGICELVGCFLTDDAEHVFEKLSHGEVLDIERESSGHLAVKRKNGTMLGYIPHADAYIPIRLISRSIASFCRLEAKGMQGASLRLAVSVYCIYK